MKPTPADIEVWNCVPEKLKLFER
ncbi:MAG: hypothetical protein HOH29_03065 [Cellvibrionales bacterium]|nr:hypothetical protein [Cellvibrionales bacterium]